MAGFADLIPADDPALDPFSRGYRAVLRALLAWRGFTDLMKNPGGKDKVGDVNDLSADKYRGLSTLKGPAAAGNLGAADYPEVDLWQTSLGVMPFGSNSLAVEATPTYSLMLFTDSMHVPRVNGLVYNAIVALNRAGPKLGLDFVRTFTIPTATYGVGAMQLTPLVSRPGDRDHAIFNVSVQMFFSKAAFAAMT